MEPSEQERALFLKLTGTKERLWRKLQDCYNLTKNLPQKLPQFKARVEQIHDVKLKFDGILDDLGLLNDKYKGFSVDVVELTSSFDLLYYEILAASGEYNAPVAQTQSPELSQKRELSLRDIQLPKYEGRPENFPAFRSMFDALVHNVNYSNIEKFTILMNHLEGPALKFAQTIRFSPENYLVAYNQLVQRYTNKRIIANHYLKTIFNLTPLKNDSRVTISELCETLQTNVNALKDMRLTDLSDFVFLQFSLRLLDNRLKEEFEEKHLGTEFPAFKDLIEFLRNKFSVSQLVGTGLDFKPTRTNALSNVPVLKYSDKRIAMTTQELPNENTANSSTNLRHKTFNGRCVCCNDDCHFKLTKCEKFNAWTPSRRHAFIKEKGLCYACFYPHNISNCRVKIVCKHCSSKRHNTLLHENDYPSTSKSEFSSNDYKALSHSCAFENKTASLLATAKTLIRDRSGQLHPCRLVLDSGSQINFITSAMTNLLQLPRKRCVYEISGIGQNKSTSIQGEVQCEIISLYNKNFEYNFNAVVLQKITSNLPVVSLPNEIRDRFQNVQLADPDFNITSPIDVLLGVQALLDVSPTEPSILKGKPSAYLTELGWVVLGNMESTIPNITSLMSNAEMYREPSLNEILRAFWEVEEVAIPTLPSLDDRNCEENYLSNVQRNEKRQYIVRLPFNTENPELTDNRDQVLNRFFKLETRFKRDKRYFELYSNVMKDYIDQGHLIPAKANSSYLLTHHGVLKQDPKGSKLRVVFNPAEKDRKGRSLNQYLYAGPKLHQDIACIITRFRLFPIGLTCDIRQMFRCIILHQEDRKYFHIFWRFSADDPLIEYEHTRVIFGATSSPYLAIRTLLQLIEDDGHKYPLASRALTQQTFVDDILTGTETPQQAKELKEQLINLLRSGGFELGKWACSDNEVLDEEWVELPLGEIPSTVKVLGLIWNVKTDMFQYKIQRTIEEPPTKRGILSRVARTFDINGYLTPFTFLLKSLIQQLWLLKIDWDDELPPNILEKWLKIKRELYILEDIKIPRNIHRNGALVSTLIGFSDASELGMAAVVYLRQKFQNYISIHLVAAKSKVRPLKTWTIPRLELGAACLLSKVMKITLEFLAGYVQLTEPICFVDSTTTLGWIRTPTYRLRTFVANRVSQIHENLHDCQWRYVPGSENPSDPASRGLFPRELLTCEMWWSGPHFLRTDESLWRFNENVPPSLPEMKEISEFTALQVSVDSSPFESMIEKISSLPRLQRIFAYIFRFCTNLRNKIIKKPKECWLKGFLSSTEYQNALLLLIRITQNRYFSREFNELRTGSLRSKKIKALSPFICDKGFLRVGGRLRHSQLSNSAKYPYLIPTESHLASLICDYFHQFSGHGGPRLTQSLINRTYWIPNSRRLIRKRIFHCLTCYRYKANPIQPPMGDLPSYRLEPGRCFNHTGVDFCGPFAVKASKLRKERYQKCYVSLFICMVSRAIHLEYVSDLTTESCIAALDRFIARRGLPSNIYSDQGTNFRGAAREISEIEKLFSPNTNELAHYLAVRGISWHHNPPYAPHMGGLWEAGVKSFKFHLKRIVGNSRLLLEPFLTTITRIEAILNSRPFTNECTSPDEDLNPLTPGHFLIGGPLLARVEVDLTKVPTNRLKQYQLTQQLVQSFWKKWAREYVQSLQKRPKWTEPCPEIKVGDLVLWFSPQAPPTHWPLGRVLRLIQGADGIARVVELKTSNGVVKRAINKVARIPSP